MSYDPSYRQPTGYVEQQWPDPGYPERDYQPRGFADPGQGFPGQGFTGQSVSDRGFAERGFSEQGFGGQGFYEQGSYGQGGYGQDGYGQGFPGQAGYADAFDGGQSDYGTFADLNAANPTAQWQDEAGKPARSGLGLFGGAMMGFLAAAVAIGVATLAAAFFRPQASPIIAVGEAFIDRTPAAMKEFAIQKFGEHDKDALLISMYVTIALLAMLIGVLARHRTVIGIVGIVVFGMFGAFVAYTRPASQVSDVIPSLIGGIAGVAALLWLASAARGGGQPPARAHAHRGYAGSTYGGGA